jgi:hypothetical protein
MTFFGITSFAVNLFRGQNTLFKLMPKNADGIDEPCPPGTTGTLVITHSLTPDSASVVATYTDLVDDGGGYLTRVFADTDVATLPLGSFLAECRADFPGPEVEQIVAQGQVNVNPTQWGP